MAAAVMDWNSGLGILTHEKICIGSAENVSNTLVGVKSRIVGMPMTTSGAVSPIARERANMIPVMMPGNEAGRMTRVMVCHFVAPIPIEASRMEDGTDRIAS